ncbi:hypothetical protein Fmac_027568 [Flemingia macrophylla]|uniref:Uncharacterized protein n=1 Tax=Flemingia macrophylla TaxID=520843 RepID=A0ABD1LI37_9FABA
MAQHSFILCFGFRPNTVVQFVNWRGMEGIPLRTVISSTSSSTFHPHNFQRKATIHVRRRTRKREVKFCKHNRLCPLLISAFSHFSHRQG